MKTTEFTIIELGSLKLCLSPMSTDGLYPRVPFKTLRQSLAVSGSVLFSATPWDFSVPQVLSIRQTAAAVGPKKYVEMVDGETWAFFVGQQPDFASVVTKSLVRLHALSVFF